ncbi:MAG: SLATT domain-containing protein [bacterium]
MDPVDTREPSVVIDETHWTDQVNQLLADWHQRVYAAQSAHYASADLFRKLNYAIGVPAVIFATVVGTAIFAGLEKDSPRALAVAIVSILAAVLAGLQTFLRFSERAAQHATAADWYSAIRREIEQILHLPIDCRGKAKDCLDEVRKEMNRAVQDAPELSTRFWQREAKRFGVRERLHSPRES